MKVPPSSGEERCQRARMQLVFVRRPLLALVVSCAALAWTPNLRAGSACPMHVEPLEPSTAWHDKAHEAESALSARNEIHHDCRSIRIEVQPEGNALLTFTTLDGRIAVRLLHRPDDILPTAEALLVTLPVETPIEMPAAVTTSTKPTMAPTTQATQTTKTTQTTQEGPTQSRSAARAPSQVLFNVFTGGRFGLEAGMFAPLIGLQATLLFSPWEFGLGAEVNPLFLPLVDSAPSGYSMRSVGGNVFLGRRLVRGTHAWHGGLSLGVAVVREQTDADPFVKGQVNIDAIQPRVGFYGGFVRPLDSVLRFRIGVQGDVALWGLRENGTMKKDLPSLSRFGLGLCVGMEVAP